MKSLFKLSALAALMLSPLQAEPPAWGKDVSKAITQAKTENKLGFILMGREACGNCQAARKLVNEGKVAVTADTFVAADIDVDDARSSGEFRRKFRDAKFGNTLPFVVITDGKGKELASYSGYKSADEVTKLIAEAKSKSTASTAAKK